jgi:hypothetical protein
MVSPVHEFQGGPSDATFVSPPTSTVPADALRDTLSELAQRYRVRGAQLAIHHGGETVSVEVGELEHGTGHPVSWDAALRHRLDHQVPDTPDAYRVLASSSGGDATTQVRTDPMSSRLIRASSSGGDVSVLYRGD